MSTTQRAEIEAKLEELIFDRDRMIAAKEKRDGAFSRQDIESVKLEIAQQRAELARLSPDVLEKQAALDAKRAEVLKYANLRAETLAQAQEKVEKVEATCNALQQEADEMQAQLTELIQEKLANGS